MNAAQLAQAIILSLIATACMLAVLRQLLPGSSRRLQAAIARGLGQPSRSRGVRAIGVWLQPAGAKAGACGSGGGCGSCGGCGVASVTKPALADGTLPLVFDTKRAARPK